MGTLHIVWMNTELEILSSIPSVFRTNGMVERGERLLEMYAELNETAEAFTSRFSVVCPSACGTCCEHFIPTITGDEALLVALYLLYDKRDQRLFDALYRASSSEACPLYNAEDPHHCQVYPVRPVVCRSFNSLPSRDKEGEFTFRSCRLPAEESEKKVLTHQEIVTAFPSMRSMSDFGSAHASRDLSTEMLPLGELVLQQIAKLLLIEKYSQDEGSCSLFIPDDDDDHPPQDIAV